MASKGFWIAAGFSTIICFHMSPASAEVRLGIEELRGALQTQKEWKAFSEHLSKEVGDTVTITSWPQDDEAMAISSGKVDFLYSNPLISMRIVNSDYATPLVTIKTPAGTSFAGSIVVRADSGINTLQDLKGKKLIAQGNNALGGQLMQRYHLFKSGILIDRDLAGFQIIKKQDDAVLAVKSGVADVAFGRTGLIEAMLKQGRIAEGELKILDQKTTPGFSLVHSTDFYPEFYILVGKNVAPDLAAKVKAAFMSVKPDSDAAKDSGVVGAVDALPFTPVETLARDLNLPVKY